MIPLRSCDLVLVRHAPAASDGRLTGRRDVPARIDQTPALGAMRHALRGAAHIVVSPALRCLQTAQALLPGARHETDARLWEQDFGAHEGVAFEDLPDLGPMERAELARYAPPGGESFVDMAERVRPALRALAAVAAAGGGPVVVLAHAGTARVALAMALESDAAALAFEIDPLSATVLRCFEGGTSVACVNATAPSPAAQDALAGGTDTRGGTSERDVPTDAARPAAAPGPAG